MSATAEIHGRLIGMGLGSNLPNPPEAVLWQHGAMSFASGAATLVAHLANTKNSPRAARVKAAGEAMLFAQLADLCALRAQACTSAFVTKPALGKPPVNGGGA